MAPDQNSITSRYGPIIHCLQPEEVILIMLAPAKVVLYYNNISLTSKIPAIYNTELY
jgi:hypothetical protein